MDISPGLRRRSTGACRARTCRTRTWGGTNLEDANLSGVSLAEANLTTTQNRTTGKEVPLKDNATYSDTRPEITYPPGANLGNLRGAALGAPSVVAGNGRGQHHRLRVHRLVERLAGAALDVQQKEPCDLTQAPFTDPRVIVTPHAVCWTDECFAAIADSGLGSVADVAQRRVPAYLVDRGVLAHPRVRAWFGEMGS
jgi:hypothetical protein